MRISGCSPLRTDSCRRVVRRLTPGYPYKMWDLPSTAWIVDAFKPFMPAREPSDYLSPGLQTYIEQQRFERAHEAVRHLPVKQPGSTSG